MYTVIPVGTDWHADLQEWLQPFLAVFSRSEPRCWAPLYLPGLLGPGARKSVEPTVVCEARSSGERKYYFTNHPADTPRRTLVRAIKARWACEQAHQQLKDELGLDYYEGRSWLGLRHHALLTMMAFGDLPYQGYLP
jgi:hypothetical protein